jgi:hypothetical protein
MIAVVGQTLDRELALDVAAQGTPGATVTYTLVGPTGAVVVNAAPATDLGDGLYWVALDGSLLGQAGLYREQWTVSRGSDDYPTDSWFILLSWQPGLYTRWELRHRLADALRDLTRGTVAAADATTVTDPERWEPDDHWVGAEVTIFGGFARPQARRVVDSSSGSGTLVVGAAWNPEPAVGDSYELHRRWTVEQYNRALARAVDEVRHIVLLPIEDVTLVSTPAVHEYVIPPAFDTIRAVEIQRTDGTWGTDPTRWERYDPTDWELGAGRRLYLRVPYPAAVRVLGEMAWDALTDEDSLFKGPIEWVVARAATALLSSRLTAPAADASGYGQQLAYFEAQAQRLLPRSRARPNSRRVKD